MIFLAPMPFGAVLPSGRLAVELGALALLLLWIVRACFRATALPSRLVCVGVFGLLGLATLQVLPLGRAAVELVSPRAVEIRTTSLTPAESEAAEERLLGRELAGLEPSATLSMDPGATASALRTGVALAALLVVAATVAAVCGVRSLALALLVSAGFQGLYGLLVVASGHPRIWHLQKQYFLDSATGTFVNRTHYSCLLAMSLAGGLALIFDNARHNRRLRGSRWVALLGTDNVRNLLLGLLLLTGMAGLLLSFSRAGIAFGLLAVVVTIVLAGRFHVVRTRVAMTLLLVSVALVPLTQLGWERLIQRYVSTADELSSTRVTAWIDSLSLVAQFPAVGCGFGGFASTYPLVRSPEIRKFFSNVHNDPLEVVVEGGVVGGVFLVLMLVPLLRRMAGAFTGALGTVAIGLAAGLAAMLLHSLVDFNFHLPANAATATILAGALLGLPWTRPS